MIKPLYEWLKKTWMLLVVIAAALLIFGDGAQLAVVVFNLSTIALVMLVADFILDSRSSWGMFPALDLNKAIDTAVNGEPAVNSLTPRKVNPIASALVVLGTIALLITILFLAVPSAHGAPTASSRSLDRARPYLPVLSSAIDKQWPAAPCHEIMAGQIEQESSWKETATLKTSRELGRGLVQMTIAYNKDGSERFNIYRAAAASPALAGWDWRKDPYNVRCQLTFLVLQDRSNFVRVKPFMTDAVEAWRAALVCYNAGEGRWLSRRAEAKRRGIAANRWINGLDSAHSSREDAVLYGRPLWQAVNEYPRVIFGRAEKYRGLV